LQKFGSVWTTQKLDAVENYLRAYTQIMKYQKFQLCYIDAFAGSGSVVLKNGQTIDGSAIRALKYPFDKFFFFEKDKEHFAALAKRIAMHQQIEDISLQNTDCNDMLSQIDKQNWSGWRGVVFLDPYAMHLSWESLIKISKTGIFDVWYLFPFMAVNRNLFKDRRIPDENKEIINRIMGATDWENAIYKESEQLNLFGTIDYEKTDVDGVKRYIISRLKETFPTVSPKPALLRNEKNSPIFLLCFAGSNPAQKARETSLRVANHILSNI
jgi:three-Cys-motif partner protein